MNKEIEDALYTLLHCSLKDTEYETQVEQYKTVRNYITNLQQENKQLKEELKYTVPIVVYNKIVSKKLKENQSLLDIQELLLNEEQPIQPSNIRYDILEIIKKALGE